MQKDSFKRTVPFFLLLNMEHNKLFFRHMLFHYFDLKKTAAAAHKLLVAIVFYQKEHVKNGFNDLRVMIMI